MQDRNELVAWLASKLQDRLADYQYSAWLIGSIVADHNKMPSDCDLLTVTHSNVVEEMARMSDELRTSFEKEFGLPLHLTRLTYEELAENRGFLAALSITGMHLVHSSGEMDPLV